MPHLNIQIGPLGPVMDVVASVSQPRSQALVVAGQSVPTPIVIRALVDTGASCTCIDPNILVSLGLSPTGSVSVHTPSTGNQAVNQDQYDVSLTFLHSKLSFNIASIPVVASNLQIQGIDALLGRDILNDFLLVFDGQLGVFTIGF